MKYKKYPSYKDSGIEWLGEIPEHWNQRKINPDYAIGKFQSKQTYYKI